VPYAETPELAANRMTIGMSRRPRLEQHVPQVPPPDHHGDTLERRNRKHVPALDGVRGIAVLMVLATHFTVFQPTNALETRLSLLMDTGWLGVDLFFVLSGYLITGILLDSRGAPGYFRAFYLRRFLRIFPAYYGLLFVLFVVIPMAGLAQSVVYRQVLNAQAWYWFYATNALIARLRSFVVVPFTGHLWSLALEEQWYLLWPVVIWGLAPRARKPMFAAIALASWLARLVGDADVLALFRIDPLAVGALVAAIGREPAGAALIERLAPRVGLVAWATMCAVWALTLGGSGGNGLTRAIFFATAVIVFAATVAYAGVSERPGRILGARWLQRVGRISYGIYLVHVPIHYSLTSWHPRTLRQQLWYWILAGGASYLVAAVSWRFLEAPILALKRYVTPGASTRVLTSSG